MYDLHWTTITPGYYESAPADSDFEFVARVERTGTGSEPWHVTTTTFGRLLSSSWHKTLSTAKREAELTYATVESVNHAQGVRP